MLPLLLASSFGPDLLTSFTISSVYGADWTFCVTPALTANYFGCAGGVAK